MGDLLVITVTLTHDVPESIIRAARNCSHCFDVYLADRRRRGLLVDGQVVGFVTPHESSWGRRHGPIFISQEHRRRGVLQAFYSTVDVACVAFIRYDNPASLAAHLTCDFSEWRRGPGGMFVRKPAT